MRVCVMLCQTTRHRGQRSKSVMALPRCLRVVCCGCEMRNTHVYLSLSLFVRVCVCVYVRALVLYSALRERGMTGKKELT